MNQALTENQSIKHFDDYSQGDDKESDEILHINGKSEDSLELTNTAKKIQMGRTAARHQELGSEFLLGGTLTMPLTDREHLQKK